MKTIKERAVEYVTELMGMIDENKPLELEREHFAKIIEETAIAFATEQKAIDDKRIKELENKEKAFLNWIAQKKWWTEFGHEDKWEITYTIQEWFNNYKAMEE